MNEASDTIRWLLEVMVPICGAIGLFYKMVTVRPTFPQVREMISDHARGGDYARDQRWIAEKFDGLEKGMEQANRHIDEVRENVAELRQWADMERRLRSQDRTKT